MSELKAVFLLEEHYLLHLQIKPYNGSSTAVHCMAMVLLKFSCMSTSPDPLCMWCVWYPDQLGVHFLVVVTCIHVVLRVYTPCIHVVLRVYTPCIHVVLRVYTPCIHVVLRVYTSCIHVVLRVYTSCIHVVLRVYTSWYYHAFMLS